MAKIQVKVVHYNEKSQILDRKTILNVLTTQALQILLIRVFALSQVFCSRLLDLDWSSGQ